MRSDWCTYTMLQQPHQCTDGCLPMRICFWQRKTWKTWMTHTFTAVYIHNKISSCRISGKFSVYFTEHFGIMSSSITFSVMRDSTWCKEEQYIGFSLSGIQLDQSILINSLIDDWRTVLSCSSNNSSQEVWAML